MCDLNGPFQLCTCESTVDRFKPHWILHRTLILKDEETTILGLLIGPNPFELYVSKNLKKRLNSTNVFDFEYLPQEGDCLELFTGEISDPDFELEDLEPSHRFEFTKGKWKFIEPFDGTINQHKNELSGPILGSKTDLTQAYEHFLKHAPQEKIDEFNYSYSIYSKPRIQISKKQLMDFFQQEE
jgi:hypothetical protein